MLNKYHITALIPARGGSKRLPRKNTKLFNGKPLIAWSINVAKASKYIDSIVVSTDDIEISEISKKFGASVPFLRPDYLSDDKATSFDVIKHAIETLKIEKENNLIVLLQPTSPLRTLEELDGALEFFISNNASGVVTVSECEHSPLWANTLPENLSMEKFISKDILSKRSQDLPQFYRLNGSIYIYKTLKLLEENKMFYTGDVFAYTTKQENSIDIDTVLDFKIAEAIIKDRF